MPNLPLPSDVTRLSFACSGTGGCAAAAAPGLSAVMAKSGLDLQQASVVLAGFSAGHGANDKYLTDPLVVQKTQAYLCFDSYYASGATPGVLSFAQRAAAGEVLMISTTSNPPGASFRTCEVAIAPLLAQLDLSPVQMPDDLSGLKPAVRVLNRGNYWHLAFEGAYVHGDHANVVAPAVCAWAYKMLDRGWTTQGGGSLTPGEKFLLVAAGLIGGYAIGRWLWKNSRGMRSNAKKIPTSAQVFEAVGGLRGATTVDVCRRLRIKATPQARALIEAHLLALDEMGATTRGDCDRPIPYLGWNMRLGKQNCWWTMDQLEAYKPGSSRLVKPPSFMNIQGWIQEAQQAYLAKPNARSALQYAREKFLSGQFAHMSISIGPSGFYLEDDNFRLLRDGPFATRGQAEAYRSRVIDKALKWLTKQSLASNMSGYEPTWRDFIQGEWWIAPGQEPEFADRDTSDAAGHVAQALENMIDYDELATRLLEHEYVSEETLEDWDTVSMLVRQLHFPSILAAEAIKEPPFSDLEQWKKKGPGSFWDRIVRDPVEAYMRGWRAVRVAGRTFQVYELDQSNIRAMQDFLLDQLQDARPDSTTIEIEESKTGSYLEMPLSEFLVATSRRDIFG